LQFLRSVPLRISEKFSETLCLNMQMMHDLIKYVIMCMQQTEIRTLVKARFKILLIY